MSLANKSRHKKERKELEMLNLLKFAKCEICDQHTPRVYVDEFEQECCQFCYDAYGECN